ncbi:hypothetical protein [Anaerobranca gottschalkii]|uniref:Uncharacterized protein n=1 Tax=Anaerobranca gottschalkii DSM 13577 TaxID=1120990 RepID=A0A1I0BVY9_9FIRM|nr:hypothetical protein [Anaerobranca gottschalkii]SET11287.1 hypothetical protein SAMN03080614_10506 [Anaerobranca gottschalkii DSM 13577]
MLEILIVSLVAGILTFYINHYLSKGPVFASATVALISGLVLPQIFENGTMLAVVATCASYAGMSAKTRMTNFIEMGLASLLSGFIFYVSQNALVGHGGRLGTIAAIAVITVWGAKQLVVLVQGYLKKSETLELNKQVN